MMLDARSRGNYKLANGLEKALRNCQNLETKLTPDARNYLETVAQIAKSDAWATDDQTALLKDAQNMIKILKQSEPQPNEETDFVDAMMRGFSAIQGNVSPMAPPNLEEDRREQQYPEICNILCEHVTCPFRKQENFNLPCKQRWTPLKRSVNPNEE